MVDYSALNWEGWLEDAPFFPAKPNDSFNLDELLNTGKAGNDVDLVAGLSELDWLDEKVDLSIFNPSTQNDAEYFNSAFNLLLDSVASNSDILGLSPETTKVASPADIDLVLPDFASQNSFETTDFVLGSSFCDPMAEASSPASITINAVDPVSSDLCLSPIEHIPIDDYCMSPERASSFCSTPRSSVQYEDFSKSDPEVFDYCMSPDGASSFCSTPRSSAPSEDFSPADLVAKNFNSTIDDIFGLGSSDQSGDDTFMSSEEHESSPTPDAKLQETPVLVKVCVKEESPPAVDETLSIDEVTASVRKRKFVNNGKAVPKIKVSLKGMFHPYEKPTSRRPRDRVERKKVQNKEAAARYRIKKRMEEEGLSGEVATLESQQSELQKTHDALASEIKYLKALMIEMLQKKGVLK